MKSWRHYLSFHSKIIFATQIIVLCAVIITSLIKLILKNDICLLWSNLIARSLPLRWGRAVSEERMGFTVLEPEWRYMLQNQSWNTV